MMLPDRRSILVGAFVAGAMTAFAPRSARARPDVFKRSYLVFTRASDGEITQFSGSIAVHKDAGRIWLDVAPGRWLPGGRVFLPAGDVQWHERPDDNSPLTPTLTFQCQDHPRFTDQRWLQAQGDCANCVWPQERVSQYRVPSAFRARQGRLPIEMSGHASSNS